MKNDTITNLFDVHCSRENSRIWVMAFPFDATTSYRGGTARGPEAIVAASAQVDLCDADVGMPYKSGIFLEPHCDDIDSLNKMAVGAVAKARNHSIKDLKIANAISQEIDQRCETWAKKALNNNKIPFVLGGDHSVPFGAIKACGAKFKDLGILQVDAHADLRKSYEGFIGSHASIMYRAITEVSFITRLVQVGIRDFCEEELSTIQNNSKICTFFDKSLRLTRLNAQWPKMVEKIVEQLPQSVYLSIDIDGLSPLYCPDTGTPVPGGLSFDELCYLFEAVVNSKRQIIGMDLCEVTPAKGLVVGSCFNSVVGARLLYKMAGYALMSHGDKNAKSLDTKL